MKDEKLNYPKSLLKIYSSLNRNFDYFIREITNDSSYYLLRKDRVYPF